ncbi:Chaperone protein HtpG [Polystyrenella longa]|uniref:Chaperone protein HtpG n=1 Tax=Polystyrenella longa TaxID=2528007 RepID=A0A518CT59_9PLAN|nr:molecular chaperone HtpG [Polystyrenella longa]QDU82364.1 Chaperone protein HtpG [Polystyrenella longa]
MTDAKENENFSFQAEIKQLLHLLSHSLYQNKEIAIRELVSNASDALDKFRHVSLTDGKFADDKPLEIQIIPDNDKHILTIRDNGIGMTKEDLISNLGTIAHSGSLDYLKNLTGDSKKDVSLIGQFGVGFYSAFMLADRVEVVTRSYQEDNGWQWESFGTGEFTIAETEVEERGTSIRLHLKEDLEEFTNPERLKFILTRYSTFVPHAIIMDGEHVNNQQPIWVEPKSQLTEEQYDSFYQYLTHRSEEKPLWHLHLSADSPIQFHSILYCAPHNMEKMGFGVMEHGLHLCAKRILVESQCRELLPEYLRFVQGIVDSADLPLNVSRESLQDNTIFRKIAKVLTKKVLDHLQKMSESSTEEYLKFYDEFGMTLREGVNQDFENRMKIAKLLRFRSSDADGEGLTSLDEYLGRAKEDQTQIYYIGGPSLPQVKNNPNLEVFKRKGLEVLYLVDPVDEFMLAQLNTFEEKQIVSVDSADIEFPESTKSADDEQTAEAEEAASTPGFEKVVELFKEAIGEQVQDVRASKRLSEGIATLVSTGGISTQLEQALNMSAQQQSPMSKRILEVNASAALVKRLADISGNAEHYDFIKECGLQIYSNAMLSAGLLPNVDEMVHRVDDLLLNAAQSRSSIVT